MAKKFRVSDESLNAYGFYVKTDGGDLSDFEKNPICLWNHNFSWRGDQNEVLPIGIWEDMMRDGKEITATPKFDMEDEFAAKIAKKVENGFLRAASIGIQILEWSDDPKLLKQGQTRPTVTKWKLREISIVDIPANKNAVALYDHDGKAINLSDNQQANEETLDKIGLKLITPPTGEQNPHNNMEELKAIALQLGLGNTATLADVQNKLSELRNETASVPSLKAQLKSYEDGENARKKEEVKSLLDAAVKENRITEARRESWQKLFDADFDTAKATLSELTPVKKLSDIPSGQTDSNGSFKYQGKTFSELSKENPNALSKLRENDFATFNQLYKAEFGKDYKV